MAGLAVAAATEAAEATTPGGGAPPRAGGLTRKETRVSGVSSMPSIQTGMTLSEIEGRKQDTFEAPKPATSGEAAPSDSGEFTKGFMGSMVGGNPKMLGRSMEVFGILSD